MNFWSWGRFFAVVRKELIQLKRDRLTFAMMVGVPIMQLTLFGFAINNDPKHLPTAVVDADRTEMSRSLVAAVQNSGYFHVTWTGESLAQADRRVERGEVQFLVHVPAGFTRALVRGEHPALLIEADASDPAAGSNALAAVDALVRSALRDDLTGPLASLATAPTSFETRVHRRYNPEGISAYNIVPGLMGVILTMTMIMMTALAVTRETERGTMENLLATPARPLEVMLGKILPYVAIGNVQVGVILLAAALLFGVPMVGSLLLLLLLTQAFILANLAVGITISTTARNQMQAMQMTLFFFLPSILLSGFMFPFRGMPTWAQWIGEALPLTHFLRVVRGILLKGNGLADVWPHLWPLLLFITVVLGLGLSRFRRTLD
ncbi:ABC-2 type transport system permease protein [Panacagrimonas perspica]|uniref:ABC-2 type transport system permease protein n=1 Tax=Panacagrimonas perspica TaxID=381431 RepID=A0A4R7P4L7_9GAMM|nr:ABC transporter permease [Panacagrimonas perspica]TDU28402.1 ABC-2 type transport system permease protein [Panacagrimonas perspica]THD00572.1 mannose-1-phosphate guanyltransferase [Panacagrimonas perspica]